MWRLGVGRTFQITATFLSMTLRENVQVALHRMPTNCGRGRLGRAAAQERGERAAELVGMADYADRLCGEIAYGDVKRLELAVALANQPKLLLMDEPPPAWRRASATS